jgi:hypothetical protein
MKLGGWQRLWIVLSAAMIVPFGLVVVNFLPQAGDVWHEDAYYEQLSETAKSQLAPPDSVDAIQVRMPNSHIIRTRPDVAVKKSTELFVEYNDIINAALRKQRISFVGAVVASWLVASLSLFAVGWVIGWVRRGFAASRNAN